MTCPFPGPAGGPAASRRWGAAVAILAVYLAIFAWIPRGAFYSPDSGGKYLQLIGYRWEGGLRHTVVYPGEACDPQGLFYGSNAEDHAITNIYPFRDPEGVTRSGWPPLFELLARPPYRAFGMAGLHLLPWLAGLAAIALAGVLAGRMRRGSGPAAAAVVGLATPVLFYSLCFWEHTLALALALAAAVLATAPPGTGPRSGPARWSAAAGLLLIATALRVEYLFFSAALALGCASLNPRARRYLPAVIGAAAALVATIAFVLFTGRTHLLSWVISASGFNMISRAFLALAPDSWQGSPLALNRLPFIVKSSFQPPPPLFWAGVLGLALCLVGVVLRARRRTAAVLVGAALVSLPAAYLVLAATRYRALGSMLLPAPLALLALLPSAAEPGPAGSRRALGRSVALFLLASLIALSASGLEDGGLEWGSRYLLVAIVGMNLLAVVAVADLRADPTLCAGMRRAVTLVAGWLLLLGALSGARGVGELRQTRRELLAAQAVLEQTGDPVVTDLWWMGASLAPFASRREHYTLSGAHPMREWLTRVGPCRPRFTYAGFMPEADAWEARTPAGMRLERLERREQGGMTITRYRLTPAPD